MTNTPTKTARADLMDSDYLEPTAFCVGGGVTGYMGASQGNEFVSALLFCGVGAVTGFALNNYYKIKNEKYYARELKVLRQTVDEFKMRDAISAANGDNKEFGLRVREIIPGQVLPNGQVSAPTIRERLVLPGEGVRVGE